MKRAKFLCILTLTFVPSRKGSWSPWFLVVAWTALVTALSTCVVFTLALQFLRIKKPTFFKYFLMDSLISFAKSLPSINLTPKNGMTHKYPTSSTKLLYHGTSTTREQPFQNSRGKSPVLQDNVLCPLNCFNSMPKKKTLLQESYTTKFRYASPEKKSKIQQIICMHHTMG